MSDEQPDLRVGILDDHRSFGEALTLALMAAPGFTCVGFATSIEDCLELVASMQPDAMLIDYQLFEGNGIECAQRLADAGHDVRLVMLSAHASPDLEERALAAGVHQVLSKDAPLNRILGALQSAVEGGAVSADVSATPVGANVHFSDRQREVLELMGQGLDPASIAERLYISLHTARGHVKDVMKLLGASTQLAAVTLAQREGYLVPPRSTATEA